MKNMKKAELLGYLFEQKPWNVALWSKKSGISINQVSRWKRGLTTNIRPNNLEVLANAAGFTVEWTDEMKTEGKLSILLPTDITKVEQKGEKMVQTNTGYLLYFNQTLGRPERIFIETMDVEYYDYKTGMWTGALTAPENK